MQIFVELLTGAFGVDFHIVCRLFGVFLRLLGSLAGLVTRPLLFGGGARSKGDGEGDEKGWFHTSASSNSLAN